MKTLLALFTALLTVSASAGGTSHKVRKVKTGSYDRIMVSGDFTVRLVAGSEGEIFLEGDRSDINFLKVYTEGDVLRIYPRKEARDWCGNMKTLVVVVPVESISEIILAGTGNVVSEVTLKADRFKTQLNGSGKISLPLETNETELFMNGSGQVNLSGSTGRFFSNVNGDGRLEAYGLRSAVADVTLIGSGNTEISSSETLNAQLSGSGRISYIGNPRIEQKIIGNGLIAARQ